MQEAHYYAYHAGMHDGKKGVLNIMHSCAY